MILITVNSKLCKRLIEFDKEISKHYNCDPAILKASVHSLKKYPNNKDYSGGTKELTRDYMYQWFMDGNRVRNLNKVYRISLNYKRVIRNGFFVYYDNYSSRLENIKYVKNYRRQKYFDIIRRYYKLSIKRRGYSIKYNKRRHWFNSDRNPFRGNRVEYSVVGGVPYAVIPRHMAMADSVLFPAMFIEKCQKYQNKHISEKKCFEILRDLSNDKKNVDASYILCKYSELADALRNERWFCDYFYWRCRRDTYFPDRKLSVNYPKLLLGMFKMHSKYRSYIQHNVYSKAFDKLNLAGSVVAELEGSGSLALVSALNGSEYYSRCNYDLLGGFLKYKFNVFGEQLPNCEAVFFNYVPSVDELECWRGNARYSVVLLPGNYERYGLRKPDMVEFAHNCHIYIYIN